MFTRGVIGDKVLLEGEYGENRTWIDSRSDPHAIRVTLAPTKNEEATCAFGREELDLLIDELVAARANLPERPALFSPGQAQRGMDVIWPPLFLESSFAAIMCPVSDCDCMEVHLGPVRVQQGREVYGVTGHGYECMEAPSIARGSVVNLGMFCEYGHRFTIGLRFHKGSTYVGTRREDDFDPWDADSSLGELWRD